LLRLPAFADCADTSTVSASVKVDRISDPSRASALASLLESVIGRPERWDVRGWIEQAQARGILLAAFRGREPVGFLGARRVAEIEIRESDETAFCYSLRPDYVYVVPDARRTGIAAALRDVLVDCCRKDLAILADMREAMSDAGLELEIEVLSFVESDEGEEFVERTRQKLEEVASEYFRSDTPTVRPAF